MKKKIILTLFLTLMLAFTACYIVYADSYDTQLTVGTSADTASEKEIAYRPITGTRYVFRINGEDIGSTTVGGLGSQNYFVNHVRNTTVNSDGMNYYNASVSQEEKGVENNRNWELVYVGWNNDNTVVFKGDKTKYYFFDTPASSLSKYTEELNGEKQFRHVIVWRRKQSLPDSQKKVYNDNFGLNGSDIKKLVEAIKIRAEKLNDEITLNQLSDIENGKVNFEIRAEILMVLRMPTYKHYKSKLPGATLIREDSDCYAYYKLGSLAYYTYREAAWIQNEVNEKTGAKYYGAVHNHFGDAASQLFEKDEPYVTEYASEATASKTEGIKSVREQWENYYNGWDYLTFENPYQAEQTTVTETAILKNEDGTETVLSGPTETKITEDTTFTRPTNSYIYTGLVYDNGSKVASTEQTVVADNGTHTIVYWYEVEKKTTITINYKDEKTGKNISPSEMAEPGTHSKKDFDGYEYTGLEIVKPNPEEKDPNKTSVTITDDKETHEIIFWYKPETKVTVEYVQRLSDGKEEAIVDSNGAPIKIEKYLKTGEQVTFLSTQVNMVSQNYQYIEVRKDGAKQEEKPETIIITGDGENHNIVFVYEKRVQINVIGVYEVDGKVISKKTLKTEESKILPLNEKYNINDYANKWDSYELCKGTPYFIQENNLAYMGASEDAKVKNQKTINITVDKNSKRVENTVNSILIVIYFEPKYTVDIYHWDIADLNKYLDSYLNIPLTANEEIKSYNSSKYINLYYEWDRNGSKFDAPKANGLYTVTVDESKCKDNHRLDFYYVSQQVEVRYVLKENNVEIAERETKSLGEISKKDISNYTYSNEYKLNNKIGSGSKVTVSLDTSISGNQTLVFYYEINDAKVNGTGGMQLGVIPSDLNNQLIGQNNTTKYWVLNNYGTLEIKFEKSADTNVSASESVNITFPFDIYRADGRLIEKDNSSQFTFSYTTNGLVCTGTTEKVYIPIWVDEKKDNNIKVSYNLNYEVTTYDYSGTSFTTSTSTITKPVVATANVEIVGAVYDFTITNLDGADLTGDTMWKKALFGTAKEYKATDTAVGQGTEKQQSKNYNYGIKRGTRFYFSLNTLGPKNQKIEITPTFYYVSAEGKQTEVTMKSNYLNNTRSISLTDANRTTTEFKNERAKKTGKTNATVFNVGDYTKITLDSNVNTPYLGIASELAVKAVKDGITLSNYANHWYGDYSIPNDAKFYKADGTLVSDETGVIIVYFEIKTLDKEGKGYLAYDGYSPFVQSTTISEWNYERQGKNLSTTFNNSMKMPKVSTSEAQVVDNIWKPKGTSSTATIIYSLRASATTKQNVTSVGTH